MNVIPMMSEVLSITNPMIRETALPNFRLAPDQGAERMGIPSFDQLERALDGHVVRRGKQEMNVIRHEHEGVQGVLTFATVVMRAGPSSYRPDGNALYGEVSAKGIGSTKALDMSRFTVRNITNFS